MRYIDETIQSLLSQTWSDFEAILVDDGSIDGTAEHIIKSYADRRLTVICQENKGMGPARAKSVQHAKGKYIAFLDHDDIWLPHKLERQLTAAYQHPEAALIFSDSLLINSEGSLIGAASERYHYENFDLRAGFAHDELLLRGCFITMSTAMVKTHELLKFGGPNTNLRYGDDYDMWLRLSRNHPIVYIDEKLAKWRIHQSSMTEKHPEISLDGHTKIWKPIVHNHSYPLNIRKTVADHLFGQQRCAFRYLLRQHKLVLASRIVLQTMKDPDPILRFVKHHLSQTGFGKILFKCFGIAWKTFFTLKDIASNTRLRFTNFMRSIPMRIRGKTWDMSPKHVTTINIWIDGTALNSFQTGYFNFVCETIRSFANDKRFSVNVIVSPEGRYHLYNRLGPDASNIHLHVQTEKACAQRNEKNFNWITAVMRSVSKMLPVRRISQDEIVEIVIWRGSFRFVNSLKIGVIQDVTPRLFPELHTADNVKEFDQYVGYIQRHADLIATVSQNSRRDIVEHLEVRPNSVHVVLSKVHPIYVRPTFNKEVLTKHGITKKYLFCVSTIEPRKNLRKLVDVFAMLHRAGGLKNHVLVIAGAQGWDDTFNQFLMTSDANSRIKLLGYVPLEDMPSLYRYASAFIYPSIYEGFGLPVLEAMCSSAKVLTSNSSSLQEIAGDVVETFDPNDEMSIAESILNSLAMSKEISASYRKQCRIRSKQLLEESVERPSFVRLISHEPAEDRCVLPSYSHL